MLSSDAVLDASAIAAILSSGNSRVPVFRAALPAASAWGGEEREGGPSAASGGQQPPPRLQFCGVLLVKELLLLDPEAGVSAGQMVKRSLLEIPADMPLFDALTLFQVRATAHLSPAHTPMSPPPTHPGLKRPWPAPCGPNPALPLPLASPIFQACGRHMALVTGPPELQGRCVLKEGRSSAPR